MKLRKVMVLMWRHLIIRRNMFYSYQWKSAINHYVTIHLKVIRKFFLKHNKSFRWDLEDYEKYNLFPFEGL